MRISEYSYQPINFTIDNNQLGLNQVFIEEIISSLLEVRFPSPNQRIKFKLSNQIIQKFQNTFETFSTDNNDIKCDERLNYKFDGVFENQGSRIGLEIQFRPDFLKDITRFQLGFHSGKVHAIIYIVAIERETINPRYTTMPKYDKVVEHLCLLNWLQVPILVIGINCSEN
jgi:hypothetical protein